MAKKGEGPYSHVPLTIYLPPQYAQLLEDCAWEDREPKSRWAAAVLIQHMDRRLAAKQRRETDSQLDIETATTRRARR